MFAIIIAFRSNNNSFFLLLLPLVFSVVNVLSFKIYRMIPKSPVTLIIVLFYFIRFCLSPFLFVIGGCVYFFPISFSTGSFFYALATMCTEEIIVFWIASSCVEKKYECNVLPPKIYSSKSNHMFIIAISLLLFILLAYFTVPEIKLVNQFVFDVKLDTLSTIDYDNETIIARGSISRYIYSLWSFLWPVLRIIIAPLFMFFFYNKIPNYNLSLFLSAGSIILPCLFIGADNISPFIGIALGAITIKHLYKKKANYIIAVFLIIAAVLLGIIISSKASEFQEWRGASGTSLFAQLLNQYFPGIENGALTLDLPRSNYSEHFFYDFYYAIPFKETLFGFEGTRLNDLFNTYVNLKGTIVPFVFQISYYFTGIGGCIFVGLCVKLAYKYEIKANNSNSFWDYYVSMYASFLIVSSISIYSFSIFLRNVIGIYLPLKLLLFISKKRNSKNMVGKCYD